MNTPRPSWTQNIRQFLSDDVMDDSYPDDGSGDDLLDRIEAAVNVILCAEYGHDIENDHCGKPEHRYCVHCHLRETTIIIATLGKQP